jgi:thiol-disulfide isomerase/thioredoxin
MHKFHVLIGLFFLGLLPSHAQEKPEQFIKCGTAKITGKIRNLRSDVSSGTLYVAEVVTGGGSYHTFKIGQDGSFSLEIPIETHQITGSLQIAEDNSVITLAAADGEETFLTIDYDSAGQTIQDAAIRTQVPINHCDLMKTGDVIGKALRGIGITPDSLDSASFYDKSSDFFKEVIFNKSERREAVFKNASCLSPLNRAILSGAMKLYVESNYLFHYPENMEEDFRKHNAKREWDKYKLEKPGKGYYSFLKRYDFNNPDYLYSGAYSDLFKYILRDSVLNLPPLRDGAIGKWMDRVKENLNGIVNADSGLFCDMLAANSYGLQLREEKQPLSDRQITQIKDYWRDKEIAKVVLRRNRQLVEQLETDNELVTHATPDVKKENLLSAIASGYEGKVVVFDFWATWCGPCLEAISKTRDLKSELQGKNVVFVYISNPSSPLPAWKKKIKEIGGEHYYLDVQQWEYVMTDLGFEYIPSYAIFKEGKLQSKFSGFPGVEKLRRQISL